MFYSHSARAAEQLLRELCYNECLSSALRSRRDSRSLECNNCARPGSLVYRHTSTLSSPKKKLPNRCQITLAATEQ